MKIVLKKKRQTCVNINININIEKKETVLSYGIVVKHALWIIYYFSTRYVLCAFINNWFLSTRVKFVSIYNTLGLGYLSQSYFSS